MTIAEQKTALRNEMKDRLRTFCADHAGAEASARARKSLLDSGLLSRADVVLGYLFHGNEADCTDILYRALLAEKKVGLPRVVPQTGDMDFYLLDGSLQFGDQITRGSFGISEPVPSLEKFVLDRSLSGTRILVIVPGMAFTRDGKRLGRGKGFYDRYLARLQATGAHLALAGFCFPCQIVSDLPTETHDARMGYVFC